MARRKRHKNASQKPAATAKEKPFFRPFAAVGKELKRKNPEPEPVPVAPPSPPPEEEDGDAFLRAMQGVAPIKDKERRRVPQPPEPRLGDRNAEDREALIELSEFVAGQGPFDIVDTDEHVEGAAVGLDPRILKRLRKGEYSVARHIDLHGLTRDEARDKLSEFVLHSRRSSFRCVLVVHGRGLHSKDQRPVLKEAVVAWLGRSSLRKQILAFCSARPYDGGVGALYVLLRK